jgi:hydroxylamine reductase
MGYFMSMFCYQCEQTAKGTGCTAFGVCGKDPETASMQDVVLHMAKGIAQYAHAARSLGASDKTLDREIVNALFLTVTNVNFDAPWFVQYINGELLKALSRAKELYAGAASKKGEPAKTLNGPATFVPAKDGASIVRQSWDISIEKRKQTLGEDITGLQELLTYGLKGVAAYAKHASAFNLESDEFYAYTSEALSYLAEPNPEANALLGLSLRCGDANLKIMELLDKAHNDHLGHPEPTLVRVTPIKGKAILVSGHDLHDLEKLLKMTEGKGINIYTHGEMLPAHSYPALKKYTHLVGNYGGAWQDQAKEFDQFPGAILMTTNCIQRPLESYKSRIYTTGLVGWPGVTHVPNGEFQPVIEAALAAPGFTADEPEHKIMVGFGHHAVLGVADKVVEGVKSGAIRHFFLIGGCDGAKTGRDYYTQLAQAVPQDCVILTLACGKYRFNKLDFGTIGGIPRLLDIGQCNDAYSAIKIAAALANAFGTDVNGLPLSMVLSWYEQKAVAILLTLLNLGVRNIRIGPSLPAFVTPAALNILVEKFALKPITTAEADLKAILGQTH